MKIRYYIAFGTCEEVQGKFVGLRREKDAHGRQLPFIVIRLSADAVVNGRRLRRGQELYGDVVSVYTEVTPDGERVLWNPREHVNEMMLHHKEFLASNPDYPDLDNLDAGQAASRKVHLFEDFDEKKTQKASGKGEGRKAAARKSSKVTRKRGKG